MKRGRRFGYVLTVFLVVCLAGCMEHKEAPEPTATPEEMMQQVVQQLWTAASKEDFDTVQAVVKSIKPEQISDVMVEVLLAWHKYKYPAHADLKLVELLLQHGADPNKADRDGYPATFLARTPQMLELLLDSPKANIDARDAGERTLLISAIGSRNLAKVQLLLKRGINPNGKGGECIPLFLAIDADDYKEGYYIVQELVKAKGIQLDIRNEEGQTPKEYAKSLGRDGLVPLLEELGVP